MTKLTVERISDSMDVSLKRCSEKDILLERYSGEVHVDSDIYTMLDVFVNIMTAYGYSRESIERAIYEFEFMTDIAKDDNEDGE